jgi:anti-anti-sigma factor
MFRYRNENNNLIFSFPEKLDTVKCREIESELFKKMDEESNLPVIFDMKNVVYISSSFLRIILQAFKKATAQKFNMINLSPDIKKVLKMAGFDKSINIE